MQWPPSILHKIIKKCVFGEMKKKREQPAKELWKKFKGRKNVEGSSTSGTMLWDCFLCFFFLSTNRHFLVRNGFIMYKRSFRMSQCREKLIILKPVGLWILHEIRSLSHSLRLISRAPLLVTREIKIRTLEGGMKNSEQRRIYCRLYNFKPCGYVTL